MADQKQSDSDLIRMLIVRVDELNKRVATLESLPYISAQLRPNVCRRCGGDKLSWQVYCGAACSEMAEYERKSRAAGLPTSSERCQATGRGGTVQCLKFESHPGRHLWPDE